jgi:hypothetical protein
MKLLFQIIICSSCFLSKAQIIQTPTRNVAAIGGSAFYKQAVSMNWQQRDSFALQQILAGNIPSFLKQFVPVHLSTYDSAKHKIINATIYVSPDYLSIGSVADWARIPLTPMAAQEIADSFHCFLPTKKIADAIYKAATVKLEPLWMFAFRDSTLTMYQHHLIIEGLRKQKRGLIAGIKKDVVLTDELLTTSKPNRVAIYGWHQLNGIPIQPLYTGHVNWYVDYSHGIRLVYRKIVVNKKWMDYEAVMQDPVLRKLLTYESTASFLRYSYQK